MKRLLAFVVVLVAAVTTVYFLLNTPAGTYRFRLTLAVETPEGTRQASSVLQARYGRSVGLMSNYSTFDYAELLGEAVFLDLGGGRNVVMLIDNVVYLPITALLGRPSGAAVDALLEGRRPQGSTQLRPPLIPTLVTFTDLNDPASAKVLKPDDGSIFTSDFVRAFGPGFRLASVTLEMVPAGTWPWNRFGWSGTPVTRGIEGKMPTMLAKLRELDKTLQLVHPNDPLKVRSGHLSVK